MAEDVVDRILRQWHDVAPDRDVSPVAVVGRISRLARVVDRRLAENFAAHHLEAWMFDVLATLRRSGEPYELTAGELVEQTMVTTGAMTNRIDRLVDRGYVERIPSPHDRRRVIVRLTELGRDVVDTVAPVHWAVEDELLGSLRPAERDRLAATLRTLLVALGDTPPA